MNDSEKSKSQLISEIRELRLLLESENRKKKQNRNLQDDVENSAIELPQSTFETALESAKDCILIWDKKYNYLFANSAAIDHVKTTPDKVIGKNIRDGLGHVPDFMKLWMGRIDLVFETGESQTFNDKTDMHGQTFYTDSILSPILNDSGEVTAVCLVYRDVTHLETSKAKFKESESKFQYILENSLDMAYKLDLKNGTYDYLSPVSIELMGFTPEELIEMGFEEVEKRFHPEDRDRYKSHFQSILDKEDLEEADLITTIEYRWLHKDGKYRWCSDNRKLIVDENSEKISIVGSVRNISETKDHENEILRLNQYLESVIDNANLWVNVLDAEGNVKIWNKAAEKISGYSACKVIGHSQIWDWVYPDQNYREEINAEALTIIKEGKVIENFDTKIITKQGIEKIISWHSRNLLDENGEPSGSIAIGRDVTDQKNYQDALAASEKRFRSIIESSPLAMYFYNLEADGSLIFAGYNPAADKIVKMDNSVFMGKTIEEAFPGLTETELPERYRLAAAKGESWYTEQVVYADGNIQGAFEVYAFQTEQNKMVVMFSEITERKRAEEKIKHSEAKFRSVIEESNDAIFIYYQRKLELVNQKFIELTGINEVEALTSDFDIMEIISPEDKTLFEAHLGLWSSGEASAGMLEFTILNADQKEIHVQISVSLIAYKESKAILAFMRDMTEYKRLEEQLRHAQKIESIGHLAGGIAHDFNNLLTPIIGTTELRMMEPGIDVALYEDFKDIHDTAYRAGELTRQLLAFSRKQVLEMKKVNLNNIIENFRKIIRRTIREDVEIIVSYGQLNSFVKIDISQIEQILLNLAVNAQDAMPEGGIIKIKTSPYTIDAEFAESHPGILPGNYILMKISDTGIGMEEEIIPHIFDPFFTTKAVNKGTGLGLSTVYGIVKQHGGGIWVKSSPGKGTVFSLYLPVDEDELIGKEDKDFVSSNNFGTETILVVEDQRQVRRIAVKILESHGYHVYSAENGQEALNKIETIDDSIDLLLTDVIMPEINGLELYKKLLERIPNIKVLYMSGYTKDVMSELETIESQFNFIQKPLTVRSLSSKVKEVLISN